MTRRNTYVCSDRNNTDRLSVIPNGKENRWERMFVVFDLVSSWKNTKTCISTEENLGLSQWTENTHRRSFPFCSRAFLVRLPSHIFGGTCFETHCLFFIVLPSVSAFLRQFFTYKCSFRPTRMEHSSLWTQMWPNSKLVNINIYKTISVSRPHSNSLLFYCWKKIQTESEEKISVVSSRYFLSFYSFFSFLVFIYVPSFFFSHHLYFSFLPVCLWFRAVGGVFFRCGMTSMTEMACATSPSSAFAAAAFGASSSSVRLRYQTVGPLYVGQAGWATLPHSYYALDYCTPK